MSHKISLEEYHELEDAMMGVCRACGERRDSRMRSGTCDACNAVYGSLWYIMNDWIKK